MEGKIRGKGGKGGGYYGGVRVKGLGKRVQGLFFGRGWSEPLLSAVFSLLFNLFSPYTTRPPKNRAARGRTLTSLLFPIPNEPPRADDDQNPSTHVKKTGHFCPVPPSSPSPRFLHHRVQAMIIGSQPPLGIPNANQRDQKQNLKNQIYRPHLSLLLWASAARL